MPQLTIQQAFDLALQHQRVGRLVEAEDLYRRILKEHPNHVHAINNLGEIALSAGENSVAAEFFRRAVAIDPSYVTAHNSLGNALKLLGQPDNAIASYRRAISLSPALPALYINLANAITNNGDLDEAIIVYRQAIALDPNIPESHNNLGNALKAQGQLDVAIMAYQQAIALKPNVALFHSNLGNALSEKGDLDQAIAVYRRAIALDPRIPELHNNLAFTLRDKGLLDEAIAAMRQSIHMRPTSANLHWDLACMLLSAGRFTEGWEEFEWRLKDERKQLGRHHLPPQWRGEDLTGKTLLLHTEGGYGDAFHFVRYAPLVRNSSLVNGHVSKIILECCPTLQNLFAELTGIDEVVAQVAALPVFDYQLPLQGLPRLFKTDLSNIPNAVPYLKVPPEYRSRWIARVPAGPQMKVGLAWAGSPRRNAREDFRTRDLQIFEPLTRSGNVQFFSLQKGPESNQASGSGIDIIDFTADLNNFADTAALIENLDLVISVDTSIAHLAGALGKPVWVLIPFTSDFRWLLNRTDSPWYPTMRLFRQKSATNWNELIGRLANELAGFSKDLPGTGRK